MTSPTNPQNNTDAASPTGGYDFDALAKKDSSELEPAEAEALAYWRSEASLRDYNPDTVAPEERVVELPNHQSVTLGDLASGNVEGQDVSSTLQAEAQGVLDDLNGADAPAAESPAASTSTASSDTSSTSSKKTTSDTEQSK